MQSQHSQELFLLGNKAYEIGDISQALQHYQSIKKKGPAVWYNMGNCYFHESNFANAIACWQRALHGATFALYENVHYNCARAYQKLGKEYSDSFFDYLIAQTAYRLPTIIIQIFFLCCWFLLWIILGKTYKTWRTYLLAFFLIMVVFYLGFVVWHRYNQQRQSYGIIMQKKVAVYVGPDVQYHALADVEIGDKVRLVERRVDWYKIAKDNMNGWIPSSAVEVIEQQS